MKPITAFYCMAALTILLISNAAPAHQLPPNFEGFEDPATCKGCHSAIYEEWAGSYHNTASIFKDQPQEAIYTAYTSAMHAAGKPHSYFCASCHTPTAGNMDKLLSGQSEPDAKDATHMRGVTCSFCHKVEQLVEGEHFNSYKITNGLKGATTVSEPHRVTSANLMASFRGCAGCHGKMINDKGVQICGMEEEGYSDCLKCHMETVDGAPAGGSAKVRHAGHSFPGGHDLGKVKGAVKLSMGAELGRLLVEVQNNTLHQFPSSSPLRVAYVKVEMFDKDGKSVFTNYKDNPAEDPQGQFSRILAKKGRMGAPFWEAAAVFMNSRLRDKEIRTLIYRIPPGAVRATAKLYYMYAPPAAIKAFGIRPDGVIEKAHLIAEGNIAIGGQSLQLPLPPELMPQEGPPPGEPKKPDNLPESPKAPGI
ncbi:MAG TPA: multiheme c-type cytochrome [Nitrospirota bacterium]